MCEIDACNKYSGVPEKLFAQTKVILALHNDSLFMRLNPELFNFTAKAILELDMKHSPEKYGISWNEIQFHIMFSNKDFILKKTEKSYKKYEVMLKDSSILWKMEQLGFVIQKELSEVEFSIYELKKAFK